MDAFGDRRPVLRLRRDWMVWGRWQPRVMVAWCIRRVYWQCGARGHDDWRN